MEMVMELAVSKRSSQSRKHASRGWLVLVMIGMLCFDSRSYAKDAPAKPSRDIGSHKAGENILRPNARKCGRNTKNTAVKLGDGTRILVYTWKEDIVNVPVIPDGTVSPEFSAGEEEIAEDRSHAAELEMEELPLPFIAEAEKTGVIPAAAEGLLPVMDERMEELLDVNADIKEVVDGSNGSGDKAVDGSNGSGDKAVDGSNGSEDKTAVDGSNASNASGEADRDDYGMREFSGFLVDEDGYITGATVRVDLTDGILILARDTGCIGIREGALTGLEGSVIEIYIPPNICEIELGVFDTFASLAYIVAAEDHPVYYSKNGIIYPKE